MGEESSATAKKIVASNWIDEKKCYAWHLCVWNLVNMCSFKHILRVSCCGNTRHLCVCVCLCAGKVQVGCVCFFVCMAIVSRQLSAQHAECIFGSDFGRVHESHVLCDFMCTFQHCMEYIAPSLSLSLVAFVATSWPRLSHSKSYGFLWNFRWAFFFLYLTAGSRFNFCPMHVCNREYKTARKPFLLLGKLKTCNKKYATKMARNVGTRPPSAVRLRPADKCAKNGI